MDIGNVTWRKASYSGDNGGGCIEVGAWHMASQSGGNGGECVEVAVADAMVGVRDSKDPEGPNLKFSPSTWKSFVRELGRSA